MRTPRPALILWSCLGLTGCGLGLESYAKYTDSGSTIDDGEDGGGVDGGGDGASDTGLGDGGGDAGGGSGSGGSGSGGSGSGGSGSGGSGGDVDNDGDGYPASYDCNDNDPSLNYDDYDGDTFASCDGDCDDRDGFTYPGAAWAESSTLCMTDLDSDGYGEMYPASGVTAGSDCNDRDGSIFPGAYDTTGDGVDQDCDGADTGGGGSGSGGSGGGGGGSTVTVSGTTGTILDYFDNYYYAIVTSGCTYVSDISFSINLDHYYLGDLYIVLQEPGGLGALIYDGGDWDYDGVSDWDGVSSSINTTINIGVGTATVYGNGTWSLIVQDLDPIIDGTLNSWSLTLTCY